MGLRDLEIEALTQRYMRERDRFDKMAATVTRLLTAQLRQAAIAHIPTFRSKEPISFRSKLKRDRDKYSMAAFEREFTPMIMDLAGARVLLYRPDDVERTCAAIADLFTIPDGDRFQRNHDVHGGYCACHRVVRLRDDYLSTDPGLANLREVLCEVQVVTIGNHVWNELEHDIIYKTPAGKPSDGQTILLRQLRSQLGLVGETVKQLMEATDRQRITNLTVIETPEQLQQALRTRCGRSFTGDFTRLLDLIAGVVRNVTPAALEKLPLGGSDLEKAASMLQQLEGSPIFQDDVRLVLVALWSEYGQDFLEVAMSWPGRRGPVSRLLLLLEKQSPGGTL